MVSSSLVSSRISSCMSSPARLLCIFRISVSVSGRLRRNLRQSSCSGGANAAYCTGRGCPLCWGVHNLLDQDFFDGHMVLMF